MAYNPYANFGMQSLYKPRQVLNPNMMRPGMGQPSPINPGKPPNIQDLLDAYLKYKDASAAAEAHHAANAGGAGSGSGVLGGGAAGAGGYWALSGGAEATAAPALELAASTPEMMLPELTPVLPGSGGAVGGGAATSGGAAASGGASSSGGYAAMTGGPGSFGYWAGPAAFIASAPVWAPILAKGGEKVGNKISKTLGIQGKHKNRIAYDPQNAQKSQTINRQLSGFGKLKESDRIATLEKFRKAGALEDQFASITDPIASQNTPDNASYIGIGAARLTDREKNALKSKYGKNYNMRAIKPEDLANILSPIGRNKKGTERLVSFKEAVDSFKKLGG